MAFSNNLKRMPGESESGYLQRIGNLKSSGIINLTWQELAEIFNKELREDGKEYGESAYRKKYAVIRKFNDEVGQDATDAEELKELRRELEKERVKVRDERNEYRKLIRDEARKESYQEQFLRSIEEAAGEHPLEYNVNKRNYIQNTTESAMIIPLYDLHTGIEIKNFWNSFDGDVLKIRMNHYLDRIFEIQERHGCKKAYVCCSELLSGLIHIGLRLQNNQDLIDQFLMVCDYICDFLTELSYKFESVEVYVAPGNHSRINPKKDESLTHENMDNLLLPFIRAKLQNFKNIYCHDNCVEQTMAVFTVYNINVVAVHGDRDPLDKVADRIIKLLRVHIDLIITGHQHTNQLFTTADVKCVQSGCLSGPDEYALNNRMRNKPEQAVCVITEAEGLDCIYDIKF